MKNEVSSGSVYGVQESHGGVGLQRIASELGTQSGMSGAHRGPLDKLGADPLLLKAQNGTPKTSGAFTLIELLVVITIIAMLAGLILKTAGGVTLKGARSRAEAEIKALETALESYKADNGDYPPSVTNNPLSTSNNPNIGLGATSLYGVLCPSTGKVYFEFKKGMTNTNGIVDPFGVAYNYCYPGATNRSGTNFFDLWSTAGGGTSNTWIQNW